MSIFNTPYYRLFGTQNTTEDYLIPYENYTIYDLFCLRTRIVDQIEELIEKSSQYVSTFISDNNRVNVCIMFKRINENSDIYSGIDDKYFDFDQDICNKIQNIIDKAVSTRPKYCLIPIKFISKYAYKYPISKIWIKSMLYYLDIDMVYVEYFFVNEDGVYIQMDPYSDYTNIYINVCLYVNKIISDMYESGYITGAENIASDWGLIEYYQDSPKRMISTEDDQSWSVDLIYKIHENRTYEKPKIYYPSWTDRRFIDDIVTFLTNRILGYKNIQIEVSDNLVQRHNIIHNLYTHNINGIFNRNYIEVSVNNLDEARKVSSIVKSSMYTAIGQVKVLSVTRLSWIKLYTQSGLELFPNQTSNNYLGYQIVTPLRSYVFSYYDDLNIDMVSNLNKIIERSFEKLVLYENDFKLNKLKYGNYKTIHDYIEQNNTF